MSKCCFSWIDFGSVLGFKKQTKRKAEIAGARWVRRRPLGNSLVWRSKSSLIFGEVIGTGTGSGSGSITVEDKITTCKRSESGGNSGGKKTTKNTRSSAETKNLFVITRRQPEATSVSLLPFLLSCDWLFPVTRQRTERRYLPGWTR